MQPKKRSVSEIETKPSQTNADDPPKHLSSRDSEAFYLKLTELWEFLGFTLIIDARQTLLDLHLFYSEVTKRGGYHKVTKDKKWNEVVSALKLEGSNVKLPTQLERCYACLLYQFEQLYHYRDPAQKVAANITSGPLTDENSEKKQKSEASLSELIDKKDGKVLKKICRPMTGPEFAAEKKVMLLTPSKDKEVKKRRGAPPRKYRTAYQIFLKQECARLRTCSEASHGSNMLHMAVDAWNKLSEIEKQPYVEESKKEKERSMEKMNTQNLKEGNSEGGDGDGDYHVALQPDADNTEVGLIDCDVYCPFDIPTEASM